MSIEQSVKVHWNVMKRKSYKECKKIQMGYPKTIPEKNGTFDVHFTSERAKESGWTREKE